MKSSPERPNGGRARARRSALAILAVVLAAGLLACRQRMADQPRYDPLEASDFFEDGRSARPLVAGTVPRGHLQDDEAFFTGRRQGKLVSVSPLAVTRENLERGQERYDIYCSPCHDRVGEGRGMVVRRGFRVPPSFHIQRLREAPDGHFFDIITNGFGAMGDYAAAVPPADRWAIVAYIRALQLSQRATLSEVPKEEREKLLEVSP